MTDDTLRAALAELLDDYLATHGPDGYPQPMPMAWRTVSAFLAASATDEPVGPVRIRSANCQAGDHDECLGMVEQDTPGLGITDCLCQCHSFQEVDR